MRNKAPPISPNEDEFQQAKINFQSFGLLLQETNDICLQVTDKRHPFLKRLGSVVRTLHEHAPAFDVLVQQDHIAAFTWGCIRLIIKVAVNLLEATEKIASFIPDTISIIHRCHLSLRTFIQSERVRDAVAALLAASLCYLIEVRRTLIVPLGKKQRAVKNIKRLFHVRAEAYQLYLREVKDATGVLDLEINIASAQSQKAHTIEQRDLFEFTRCAAVEQKDFWLAQQRANDTIESKVCSVNRAMIQDQRRKQLERFCQWLHRGFRCINDSLDRAPNTWLWLQETPEWNDWKRSEWRDCFQIIGQEGCGKSNAAHYLGQTLADIGVVFRHSFSVTNRCPAPAISQFAVSIIRQIIARHDHDSAFHDVVEKVGSLSQQSDAGIWCKGDHLQNALNRFLGLFDRFTLIVDGVGESSEVKERNFQGWMTLFEYLRLIGSWPSSRVIILLRPGSVPQHVFAGSPQMQISPELVKSDIKRFLEYEVERNKINNPALSLQKSKIVDEVSEKCGGTFLLAKLLMDDLKTCATPNAIKSKLYECSYRLSDFYQARLSSQRQTLGDDQKVRQQDIFRVLLGARQPISTATLDEILAHNCTSNSTDEGDINPNPTHEIWMLCSPFLNVVNGQVQHSQASTRDFLEKNVVSPGDPDELLARKTLSKLNEARYKRWEFAAQLLRKNLPTDIAAQDNDLNVDDSSFYVYACLHWYEHLTALPKPPYDILGKLRDFLVGTQFVSWSETTFQLKPNTSNGTQIQVKEKLTDWYDTQSPDVRSQVPLDKYYTLSHENLSKIFAEQSGDKLLQYLPLVRLGTFFNVSAKTDADLRRGYEYKMVVAAGYRNLLGPDNPLALRARAMVLKEYFWQKRYDEAVQGFEEVAESQRKEIGEDQLDYLSSLQLYGLSLLYVTKFASALQILDKAAAGYVKVSNKENINGLVTRLYIGQGLERLARYVDAYNEYDKILSMWISIGGKEHPFTLMLKTALGSASRQQGRYEESETLLFEALAIRKRLFGSDNRVYVDSVIQLATTYYCWGRGRDSIEYLDLITDAKDFKDDFERQCEAVHIRALVDIQNGHSEKAKNALRIILDEASGQNRDKNNRELLWARITLADLLRRDGQDNEALMLFSDLVISRVEEDMLFLGDWVQEGCDNVDVPTLVGEPEPPAQLALAEEALRLVREAKAEEADCLLEKNDLRWQREKDFWVVNGGPVTDTASISGLKPPLSSAGPTFREATVVKKG